MIDADRAWFHTSWIMMGVLLAVILTEWRVVPLVVAMLALAAINAALMARHDWRGAGTDKSA